MAYRSNGSGGQGPKRSGIPWWVIVLCFLCGLWPLGIVLLIVRLGQENGAFSSRRDRERYERFSEEAHRGAEQARRAVNDAAQSARDWWSTTGQDAVNDAARSARTWWDTTTQPGDRSQPDGAGEKQEQAAQSAPAGRAAQRLAWLKGRKSGKVCTTVGAIMMALFGFSTLMQFVDDLSFLFYEPLWILEDVLPLFILTGVGAGLFVWGRARKGQIKRFRRYITLIGEQQRVSVSALAAAYPARPDACRTALENMIEEGVLGPGAYLDYGRDLLVLDGSGVQQGPPETEAAPEDEDHVLLRQIRQINDAIANPELSRKIDRIEEITERILEFQREHPEKTGELRRFLNYYLPTTLKILRSYAELEKQGVAGENIDATKRRIENMMDMVVEGFERQLDKLFAGDMMDIAADITVMERMMQDDGLFNTGGAQMGGH